jgi:GNAT superfamily N-acetyltransferase
VRIRLATTGDLPYLEDLWSKSRVKVRPGPLGDRWVHVGEQLRISPRAWHAMQRAWIRSCLEWAGVLVLHRPDAPDVVLACCVYELGDRAPVLHWVWTRPELRRRGYASALLRHVASSTSSAFRASHMTTAGQALLAAFTSTT